MHDVGVRVVAHADELDELDALGLGEGGEVARAEVEDDFPGGWVRFAHVGRVAEAEGGGEGRGLEGFGEFCGRGSVMLRRVEDGRRVKRT